MRPIHTCIFSLVILLSLPGCNNSPGNTDNKQETENIEAGSSKSAPEAVSGRAEEETLRQLALEGDLDRVKELLDSGTKFDSPNPDGRTALMSAAYNGHTEIVKVLIEKGASVDRRDLMGRTALLYAATGPFPETVKTLLEEGAQPNIVDSDEHFSPLMFAASEGNLEVVRILLQYNADPSLKDVDGDNAESFARQAGHTEIAEALHSVR